MNEVATTAAPTKSIAQNLAAVEKEVTEWVCVALGVSPELEPSLEDLRCMVERRPADTRVSSTLALLSELVMCVDMDAAHELSSRQFTSATALLRAHGARLAGTGKPGAIGWPR